MTPPVESVAVQTGQHTAEGPLTGHQIPAGERVVTGADTSQDLLTHTGRPLPDRRHRVIAHDQSRARDQHQDHDEGMATAPHRAGVGHLAEPLHQRRRHGPRVRGEFGLPQGQIRELVKNRTDRRRYRHERDSWT